MALTTAMLAVSLLLACTLAQTQLAAEEELCRTEANVPVEITFTAQQPHEDPFNTVTLDVLFTDRAGVARRVPAFWAGGAAWKVRYASAALGTYRWRSECHDTKDAGLHGVEGSLQVQAYRGENTPLKHGPLQVAADDKFSVWVNGIEAGSGADWNSSGRFDVSKSLKAGVNVIAVRAENMPAPVKENPAGLIASLDIDAGGQMILIHSDASWRVEKTEAPGWRDVAFDDSRWPHALVAAHYGEGPWARFDKNNGTAGPFASGIGDRLRVFYALAARSVLVRGLAPDAKYHLTCFDPVTGERTEPAEVETAADGSVCCPAPAHTHDWVAVLERNIAGAAPKPSTP